MRPYFKKITLFVLSLLTPTMKVTGVSAAEYTYLHDGTLSITEPNTLPNAVYPVIFTNNDSKVATLQFSAPLNFQNPIIIGKDFEAVIDVDTNPINLYSQISDLTSEGNLSFVGGNTVTAFGAASNSGTTSIDAGTTLKAGSNALFSNTSGTSNVAFGLETLYSNTTGRITLRSALTQAIC